MCLGRRRLHCRAFSCSVSCARPIPAFAGSHADFSRTLIFDIIRLVAMIELSEAGDDITCKFLFFA